MFIRTSAVVALLANEIGAKPFIALIERSERREAGAHVRLELIINLVCILGLSILEAQQVFDDFIGAVGITVVSISDVVGRRAVEAFATYGKGRGHPAQLNFVDCLYLCVCRCRRLPILFKGRDLAETDLGLAIP